MPVTLKVLEADITTLAVDAVVNAANAQLAGGGGVDGAIHRAAGPDLMAACRAIGGCPAGEVRVTPGFNLPAAYVFHAVGPVWQGGAAGEEGLLAGCYAHAIREAAARSLATIAFPAISTGVYGYPADQAAQVAVRTVRQSVADTVALETVVFCCFSAEQARLHEAALAS